MPTPSTGELSFNAIQTEFGQPSGKNLGAYRVSATFGHLSNLPLDNGVPQSNQIAFSDMRGRKLNVVVNNYSSGYNNTTRRDAAGDYDSNAVCVGGFRTPPGRTDLEGRRVYIAVNQTIGSDKGGRKNVALKVPNQWSSGAIIRVDIGPSGRLQGAGGNGGNGGGGGSDGQDGSNGSSALGISKANAVVVNGGVIRCGFGGGGGGGGAYSDPNKDPTDYASGGGGGGGGAGLPAGSKGDGGNSRQNGQNGNNGDLTNGGGGGSGGDSGDARGGSGGSGGGDNGNPGGGQGGQSDRNNGGGSSAGQNGIGIIVSPGGSYNSSGNAIIGGVSYEPYG